MDAVFQTFDWLDDQLWNWIGFPLLLFLGAYFTWKSGFSQLRELPLIVRNFTSLLRPSKGGEGGVHPIAAFFACVGGCVGIGNIVIVSAAVQVGGPGAVVWIWITALIGMAAKYAEIYLGMQHRVAVGSGWHGGPMFYLQRAYKGAFLPLAMAFLLLLYSVEIYQFRVVTTTLSENFSVDLTWTTLALIAAVVYVGLGGVRRVGQVATLLIPLFMVLFLGMGLWVLLLNIHLLPETFADIFRYAFTPHAVVGGSFAGVVTTISQGIRRGSYTGDIGVGYASVLHSESSIRVPEQQAALAYVDMLLDTFIICSVSLLLILVTGTWNSGRDASFLVQDALQGYFPYAQVFMPVFLTLLGFSTLISYYCVGVRCAEYLHPRWGKGLFVLYSITMFWAFSFYDTTRALVVMSLVQVGLVLINCIGMWILRKEVSMDLTPVERELE